MRETLVELSHVCKFFDMGKDITLKAVDDISFCIYKGESLGLVGAQGCGKSTLAKVISGAEATTSGSPCPLPGTLPRGCMPPTSR